jgi:hypothetical protein
MTTTAEFIDTLINYQMQIEDIAVDAAPKVKERFREILADPEQINDEIAIQFLEAEMSVTDMDEAFWNAVSDGLDMGFMGLLDVPIEERAEAWDMAQQLVVAIAQRQAMLESVSIIEGLKAGAEYGASKAVQINGLDIAELQASNKFKSMIKAKRNAIQNA